MAAEQERTQPLAGASAAEPSGSIWKNRYLIERELGRGGFGIVYLARDQQLLSRPVVIKLLQDGTSPDPYFQKKFQQEIEAMARIDHPGVVGVLDTGESPDRRPFLVMQFVEGVTLRTLIGKQGMEFRQAARILRQVGQALSAAHDKGVFHRDLKPENIMVQQLGEDEIQVKLIDFGIASVRDSQIVGGQAQASKVVGTLAYMAPEQVMGQATGASDVYALGVIAYEMLTGQRPEITPQGLSVKPRELRADIPDAAETAIVKAVAYQPEQRQTRPRDFGEEIARALGAEASISAPVAVAPAPSPSPSSQGLEMAYVLFMDLVSYSMLPMDLQSQRIQQLVEIVRGTAEYRRASDAKQIISLPTGDGMALVFFQNPVAPVQCAIEVARALKNHAELKLRMGVHTGPVYRIADINTNSNVAGGGINLAQRVMDVGDAGHILVSRTVADTLNQLSDWSKTLQDLGEAEVKHGVKVHVVNLVTSEVGNPEIPEKFKKARALVEQIPAGPALPVPAAKAAVPATIAAQPQAPAAYQQSWNQAAPAVQSGGAGKLIGIAAAVVVVAALGAWKLGVFGGGSKAGEQQTPGAAPAGQVSSGGSPAPASSGGGSSGGADSPGGAAAAASGGAAAAAVLGTASPAASKAASPATAKQTSMAGSAAAPASAAAPTAQTSATPPSAAPQPTPPPATANPALGGLRSEYAQLAGRANSVANSLGRMEQQQARMGVGLRGDMAAARDSMEYLMGEAKSALEVGDAEGAKRNLGLAERQIEKLEDFLGR
jgi:serine/threonine protein kinase